MKTENTEVEQLKRCSGCGSYFSEDELTLFKGKYHCNDCDNFTMFIQGQKE